MNQIPDELFDEATHLIEAFNMQELTSMFAPLDGIQYALRQNFIPYTRHLVDHCKRNQANLSTNQIIYIRECIRREMLWRMILLIQKQISTFKLDNSKHDIIAMLKRSIVDPNNN